MHSKTLFALLLSGGLASAGVITVQSGSLSVTYGEYPDVTLTLDAPGFHLQDWDRPLGVPTKLTPTFCNGTCLFSFSGAFNSSTYNSPSLTFNGTSYRGSLVRFSLTITGTPTSAVASCTSPPHATCITNWAPTPFTFTGSITVWDSNTGTILVDESLLGGGSATAYSYYSTDQGPWNYTQATYAFSTPEPGAGSLVILGGTLALVLRARRRVGLA